MADSPVPLSPYLFYTLLSYPLPFEREFFAYDLYMYSTHFHRALQHDDAEHYVWSDQDALSDQDVSSSTHDTSWYTELTNQLQSWSQLSTYVRDAIPALIMMQRFIKLVPFVEALYVVWPVTCNAKSADRVLSFWLVTDVGRVWIVSWVMRCMSALWNLWVRWQRDDDRGALPFTFSVSMIFDRTRAHLTPLKTSRHDVMFVYNLAHAVPLYFRSSDQAFPLYEYNRWIKDYLPNFPGRHVISFGLEPTYGRTWVSRFWTHLLSWWVGDFLERILRWVWKSIVLMYSFFYKSGIWSHGIVHAHIIMKPDMSRKKNALKRKVFKSSLVKELM